MSIHAEMLGNILRSHSNVTYWLQVPFRPSDVFKPDKIRFRLKKLRILSQIYFPLSLSFPAMCNMTRSKHY